MHHSLSLTYKQRGESPHTNGSHAPADAETVQEMVQSREARIAELEQEGLHLRNRLLTLEMDVRGMFVPRASQG